MGTALAKTTAFVVGTAAIAAGLPTLVAGRIVRFATNIALGFATLGSIQANNRNIIESVGANLAIAGVSAMEYAVTKQDSLSPSSSPRNTKNTRDKIR